MPVGIHIASGQLAFTGMAGLLYPGPSRRHTQGHYTRSEGFDAFHIWQMEIREFDKGVELYIL